MGMGAGACRMRYPVFINNRYLTIEQVGTYDIRLRNKLVPENTILIGAVEKGGLDRYRQNAAYLYMRFDIVSVYQQTLVFGFGYSSTNGAFDA